MKLITNHVSLFSRALNYGMLGTLLAKDLLHLLLPDSMSPCYIAICVCLSVCGYIQQVYAMITSVSSLVLSQSDTAVLESECVWSRYLTAQKGTSSLSPSQQQEVWVQYSALQLALLVSVCTFSCKNLVRTASFQILLIHSYMFGLNKFSNFVLE